MKWLVMLVVILVPLLPSCGGCTDTGLIGETDAGADPVVDTSLDTSFDPVVDTFTDPVVEDVEEDTVGPCPELPDVVLPDLGEAPWARFEGDPIRMEFGTYL